MADDREPQRTGTGLCANCGWTRAAMLYDGRIVFSASHDGPAGVREPKKCYECRTWSSMSPLEQVGWIDEYGGIVNGIAYKSSDYPDGHKESWVPVYAGGRT